MFGKIKKLFSTNWSELLPLLKQMSQESHRSQIELFRDMYRCYNTRGINWGNYAIAGFHLNRSPAYRASCLSQKESGELSRRCNSRATLALLEDKGKTLRHLQSLIKREFVDLRVDDFAAFKMLLENTPRIFSKPPSSCGGEGILCHACAGLDARLLYDELLERRNFIVEAAIKQHPEMAKLSCQAANSLRVMTCVDRKQGITVPYVSLRVCLTDAYCDNASMGGAFTVLDERGRANGPLLSYLPQLQVHACHPHKDLSVLGFQVPFFEQAKALAKSATAAIPGARFIGWDLAITADGAEIIEANSNPSPDLGQSYVSLPHGRGIKAAVLAALGEP